MFVTHSHPCTTRRAISVHYPLCHLPLPPAVLFTTPSAVPGGYTKPLPCQTFVGTQHHHRDDRSSPRRCSLLLPRSCQSRWFCCDNVMTEGKTHHLKLYMLSSPVLRIAHGNRATKFRTFLGRKYNAIAINPNHFLILRPRLPVVGVDVTQLGVPSKRMLRVLS